MRVKREIQKRRTDVESLPSGSNVDVRQDKARDQEKESRRAAGVKAPVFQPGRQTVIHRHQRRQILLFALSGVGCAEVEEKDVERGEEPDAG
jgi:quercetin dioxygenase-like cupin family protein